MNILIDYYVYEDTRPQHGLSSPLHKGLIPVKREGQISLAEEGLGFGLPILRYKRDFYFPGSGQSPVNGLIVNDSAWKCYKFNLIERSKKNQQDEVGSFSWVIPRLYHRLYEFPFLRKFLTLGRDKRQQVIKRNVEIQTTFHQVKSRGEACTSYTFNKNRNKITLKVELKNMVMNGLQHIYIMNELGGVIFDTYYDSLGNHLEGANIGEWNIISAKWGVLYSEKLDLGFKVHVPSDTVAFRGREVIGNIICWSGIALRIQPDRPIVQYDIEFGNKKYLLQNV
ncbi:MAG: hypothetical protein ACFFF4_14770 [Candidatus Thorarchaeota archaeon]